MPLLHRTAHGGASDLNPRCPSLEKLKILELAHQGRSIRDICSMLDKEYDKYRPFVSKVIGEYRRRGVLAPIAQT